MIIGQTQYGHPKDALSTTTSLSFFYFYKCDYTMQIQKMQRLRVKISFLMKKQHIPRLHRLIFDGTHRTCRQKHHAAC